MQRYIDWMDIRAKWLKIVLAVPFLDITWGLYRLFKNILKKDVVGIVFGAITIAFSSIFGIIDIVFIALYNHPVEINTEL